MFETLLIACVAGAPVPKTSPPPPPFYHRYTIETLLGNGHPQSFRDELEAVRRGPQSRATAVAASMIGWIPTLPPEKAKFESGYEWEPGTHCLETRAGRAAFVFEQLTGSEILPKIGPKWTKSSRAEGEEAATVAKKALTKHMTKFHNGPGMKHPKAADVKDRVRKLFDQDVDRVGWEPTFHQSLTQLYGEWNPIGQKFDDLRDIIGPKFTKRTADWPGPGKNERNTEYSVHDHSHHRGKFEGSAFFFLVAPDGTILSICYDTSRGKDSPPLADGKGGPATLGW